jgi:hypothetical protein
MRDLECEPSTLVGPVDPRVVRDFQERYPLDSDFLAYMNSCHGGVPKIGAFEIESNRYQIGMFLTLFDEKSDLPPPFRPHFEDSRMDERVMNSICFLKNYEHATSRALFGGLLPFAALETGMCLDRAYVDLLCLDYRKNRGKPSVVLWSADRANRAYMKWDELPLEEQFDEEGSFNSVPWDEFVTPVAPTFAAFVEMLRPVGTPKPRK